MRDSKIVDLVGELMGYSIHIHIGASFASPNELAENNGNSQFNVIYIDKLVE